MYMMMAKITLVLTTLFLLISQKGSFTGGQNICSENGTSVVINDTLGTIHVPSIYVPENDQTNKACYWRFEPVNKTYGVELSVDIDDGQGEVKIDLIDQEIRETACAEDGYCSEYYEYKDKQYHGICFREWSWLIWRYWTREYCLVDGTSKKSRCIPCEGSGSTNLKHGKKYCYNNCGAEFESSENCDEELKQRNVDAFIMYSNTNLENSFNITYNIIPCAKSDSVISTATTAAKTTIDTTITQETAVHENITSLTQQTISEHSTETKSSQEATTPPTGTAADMDAGKQTGNKTLTIVLPIIGAILIILLIIVAVIVIKRRRHLNALSSAKTTVNNAYEQTNFDQAETSPEMVDNILYDSLQQQNEKIEVENELYGSA
ncbi:uncharacterized protein LOC120336240 [Styela clava]